MIQTPVSFTQEGLPCSGFRRARLTNVGGRVSRHFVISFKVNMLLRTDEGSRRRVFKFRCACQQNVEEVMLRIARVAEYIATRQAFQNKPGSLVVSVL